MRKLITEIFKNFMVNGKKIPVSFLRYDGHETSYVTWMQYDMDNSFSADDELMGYVEYYDFDVYSKGNYMSIIEEIKKLLKAHDFVFQPSRCSPDMYEDDTGYYHKTLCFAIPKEEI